MFPLGYFVREPETLRGSRGREPKRCRKATDARYLGGSKAS